MARKLIATVEIPGMPEAKGKDFCKVYHDSDYSEFIVQMWNDGKYCKNADYFAEDKADALKTAARMLGL